MTTMSLKLNRFAGAFLVLFALFGAWGGAAFAAAPRPTECSTRLGRYAKRPRRSRGRSGHDTSASGKLLTQHSTPAGTP